MTASCLMARATLADVPHVSANIMLDAGVAEMLNDGGEAVLSTVTENVKSPAISVGGAVNPSSAKVDA